MATVDIDFRFFFDRERVRRATDRARRRVLSKSGAFIRTRARSSIRPARRKRLAEMSEAERSRFDRRVAFARARGLPRPKRPRVSSRPGEPPRSQIGLLRKRLFFAYDPRRDSVVVGPERFKDGNVPAILEYGGVSVIGSGERRVRARIEPRPYMGPALKKELPKLAPLWKNSIKASVNG